MWICIKGKNFTYTTRKLSLLPLELFFINALHITRRKNLDDKLSSSYQPAGYLTAYKTHKVNFVKLIHFIVSKLKFYLYCIV